LLQTNKHNHHKQPKTWDKGSSTRHSGSGNIVIQMLDKIVDDVRLEQRDSTMAEKEAMQAYVQHTQTSRTEFASRMRETTEKVTRRARLKVQLGNQKETLDEHNDKLSAITQQILALHNDCDQLLATFEARTKARSFEIAQLRDVDGILSGAQEATRTMFLNDDEPDELSDDQEAGRLHEMSRTTADISRKARRALLGE